MLTSRGLLSIRRLPAIVRACSDAKDGRNTPGASSDQDGLASFLNVVQSTQAELEAKRLQALETGNAQLEAESVEKPKFTTLLRNSQLTQLGYIKNGFVTKGVITNVVNDTIFVDFGGKFPFVTQRPAKNGEFYVRGAEVLAKILDWELTARFIGAETDSTLCESEGRVLRLLSSPLKVDGSMSWKEGVRSEQPTADDDHHLSEIDQYLDKMEANKKLLQDSLEKQ